MFDIMVRGSYFRRVGYVLARGEKGIGREGFDLIWWTCIYFMNTGFYIHELPLIKIEKRLHLSVRLSN